MTGQSAKRLGLEVEGDLELELRLRRIEESLDGKIDANQDAAVTGRGKGGVPQVTGLRVTGQTPGSVTIAWNPVAIPDLRRYELNFATNLGYSTNLKSAIEATTQYTFNTASATGGGGGATWYARVRAVNSSGVKGTWSVTLNLTTGQAQSEDIGDGQVTDDNISSDSNTSILVQQLRGFIDGFILSRTSATVLNVAAGFACTNILGTFASLTANKSIDLSVVGAGGLGTTVAANTWYHVFAIINSTDSSTNVYADTSATAANIPSGYGARRRLGAFKTDGSSQIIPFIQHGDLFVFTAPGSLTLDHSATNVDYTGGQSITLENAPTGVKTEVMVNYIGNSFSGASNDPDMMFDGGVTTAAPSGSASPLANAFPGGSSASHAVPVWLLTDGGDPPTVTYRVTLETTANIYVLVLKWRDLRGKDA